MSTKTDLLIDGKWLPSNSGKRFKVTNPANGVVIAECALAGRDETVLALEAAQRAFSGWSNLPARERAKLMHKAMEIFRPRIETIARILTQEHGKAVNDSLKELKFSADVIDYYAEEGRRIKGEHFEGDGSPTHSFTMQQPVGVVAAITPWNFPVDLLSWKVGPALAVGCTMVIKPPSEAPLAASEFIRCFHEAGIPEGVINLVMGPGSQVGAELVTNPISRKIAFTGSTATGLWIAQEAAKQLKKVTLELGGSAPFIVFDDAELDRAVSQAIRRTFSHSGQICISVNRIYVQKKLAAEFTAKFTAAARNLRVANGLDVPDADMGPMINEEGRETVRRHVADALEHGAQLMCGGKEPQGPEYENGLFYLPTVLSHVNQNMLVMQEETFGPVAPIAELNTIDEGISLANQTKYGLAAYVFTQDIDKAFYAAEKLDAGGIGININDITDIRGPFGGRKMSGVGRELGAPGLDSYLEWKHVRVFRRRPVEQ